MIMKQDASDEQPVFLDLEEIGEQQWTRILQEHSTLRCKKNPHSLLGCLLQERLCGHCQQSSCCDCSRRTASPDATRKQDYPEASEEDYLEAAEEEEEES